MNTSTIISGNMTLEEKLAAIDQAMANAKVQADEEEASQDIALASLDPQDLLMCNSCQ